MKLSKEKMWRSSERAMKRTKGYQEYRELGQDENYELAYVLAKGRNPCAEDIIAVAMYEDDAIQFFPCADREEIDLWALTLTVTCLSIWKQDMRLQACQWTAI